MSSNDWEHDDWVQQFNTMLNGALGNDPDEPFRDDADEMAVSDIAAKFAKGKITLDEAIKRTMGWLAGRMGLRVHDQEAYDLEMQVGGLVEVTDGVKNNLLIAGEPGIADAIIKLHADPRLLISGPGDEADLSNPPTIGAVTKSWFDFARLHPNEAKNLHWAVHTALKEQLGG